MLSLVLPLLLAADGGTLFSDSLYSTCREAPPVVQLDGGWVLLPPERAERNACLMATCETDRQTRQNQSQPAQWVQVTTAIASAVIAVASVVNALSK